MPFFIGGGSCWLFILSLFNESFSIIHRAPCCEVSAQGFRVPFSKSLSRSNWSVTANLRSVCENWTIFGDLGRLDEAGSSRKRGNKKKAEELFISIELKKNVRIWHIFNCYETLGGAAGWISFDWFYFEQFFLFARERSEEVYGNTWV